MCGAPVATPCLFCMHSLYAEMVSASSRRHARLVGWPPTKKLLAPQYPPVCLLSASASVGRNGTETKRTVKKRLEFGNWPIRSARWHGARASLNVAAHLRRLFKSRQRESSLALYRSIHSSCRVSWALISVIAAASTSTRGAMGQKC